MWSLCDSCWCASKRKCCTPKFSVIHFPLSVADMPLLVPIQQLPPLPLVPHWLWVPPEPIVIDSGDDEVPVGPDPLRENMFQQQQWDDGDSGEPIGIGGGYGHFVLDEEDEPAEDAGAEPAADPDLGHVPPAGECVPWQAIQQEGTFGI